MNQINQILENRQLKKEIQLNCPTCRTIYQLIEIHRQVQSNCSDNCLQKWQAICHEYHQEKVLGYLQQQEFAEENQELGIKVKKK